MVREQDAWLSQIRKGAVEIAVLGLLSSGERYGSQIVEELASLHELEISAGTIYPLLSRMKKAGAVESNWQESPVGPPRKYYRLTDAGRVQLAGMYEAWNALGKGIDSLMKGGRG